MRLRPAEVELQLPTLCRQQRGGGHPTYRFAVIAMAMIAPCGLIQNTVRPMQPTRLQRP